MGSASATRLRPSIDLAGVLGGATIYNPRQPYATCGISRDDEAACDGVTGGHLVAAGPLRVICHRDAATPAALDLLSLAGHALEADLLVYGSRDEYEGLLARAGPGEVAYQHVHPPSEARPETYAIERGVLLRLTNKGRLHEVVDGDRLPRRRVLPTRELATSVSPGELPVVVKAACDESLGGGDGVRICRSPADVAAAARDFDRSPEAVVEEHVQVVSNWCVNFAVAPGEPLRYLGAAEQIVSDDGAYRGSRIEGEPAPALVEAGRAVAETARSLGYRGIAGFDVVGTDDGRTLVLDVNCRLNSCTTALLLRDSVLEWSGHTSVLASAWRTGLDDLRLHAAVSELVERRSFVPIGFFLPEAGTRRVIGIVLADGRHEAEAAAARVRAALA